MIALILAFATATPNTVCDAGNAKPEMDGKEVAIVGILVFSRHSAHIIEAGETLPQTSCAVFTVFPGTPSFLVPGLDGEGILPDRQLQVFSKEYKVYLDRYPQAPKKVLLKGILKVRRDFKRSQSLGNGFGFRGVFRTAVLVKAVEFAGE